MAKKVVAVPSPVSPRRAAFAIGILLCLIFSKYFYLASLTSYYTLYLIDTFGVSVPDAQLRLFVFLGAVAAGTFFGGPVGDRVGFKAVIWGSILGVLPFTLALPHANLFWTTVLTVPIGLILASAFSAIMVYAQELLAEPGGNGGRAVLRVRVRDGRGRCRGTQGRLVCWSWQLGEVGVFAAGPLFGDRYGSRADADGGSGHDSRPA